MIIQNGYIEFGLSDVGEFVSKWGERFPCQYVPKVRNLRAFEDGNATDKKSYEIYVEMPLDSGNSEVIRLTDMSDAEQGIFPVVSFEELRAVQQVKIIV